MKRTWRIEAFDDYHSIRPTGKERAIELGCFPQNGYDYGRYFGLFYTGRRPPVDDILARLKKMVNFGTVFHYRAERDISVTEEEVASEVRETLGLKT